MATEPSQAEPQPKKKKTKGSRNANKSTLREKSLAHSQGGKIADSKKNNFGQR